MDSVGDSFRRWELTVMPPASPVPTSADVDVLIVGAGISGIGAAYYLQREHPQRSYADPGSARGLRRHLGPVPLPGHPVGLGPAHVRLRVQALARRARDRERRQDPRVRARDSGRVRHRRQDPLSLEGDQRVVVLAGRPVDSRGRAHRHRRAHDADLQLDVLRGRLLPLRRGLHAALRGARAVPRADRPPAALARRISITPASGCSSSAAAPRPSPWSRRWRTPPRT